MDWTTIAGSVLALAGASTGIWAFLKAKNPKANDIITIVEQIFKQLTDGQVAPGPIVVPVVPPAPNVVPPAPIVDFDAKDRVAALKYVELLMRYMEQKSSKVGTDALLVVVTEILSPKAE
jgi:hypothetical protein